MQNIRSRTISGKLISCEKCGNPLDYKGLGEYYCPICEETIYDDYGIVRNYVEENPTATIKEISVATGVSKERIREFVDQDRFVERRFR